MRRCLVSMASTIGCLGLLAFGCSGTDSETSSPPAQHQPDAQPDAALGPSSDAQIGDAPLTNDVLSEANDTSSSMVIPSCDAANRCTFAWNTAKVVIDAAAGARIVEMSLDATNILVTSAEVSSAFGSTFWTSPQSAWNWPPIPALDSTSYSVAVEGHTLALRSSPFAIQNRDLRVKKTFYVNRNTNVLRIDYALENTGPAPLEVAAWEITRVHPNGLTFFPNPTSGQKLYPASSRPAIPTQSLDGVTFLDYDKAPGEAKLFAEGGEKGYLAHVRDDLLFVKSWTDVPSTGRAPEESEVEIYTDPAHTYVELEQQGPYGPLVGGSTNIYRIAWSLTRLATRIASPKAAIDDPTTRALLIKTAEDIAKAIKP